MELPTEIRLKILRYLLRSSTDLHFYDPEPDMFGDRFIIHSLRTRLKHPSTELLDFQSCNHLSSQLLRCCKNLKDEGEAILYGENRLCVAFRADCYDGWREQLSDEVRCRYLDNVNQRIDCVNDGLDFIDRFHNFGWYFSPVQETY